MFGLKLNLIEREKARRLLSHPILFPDGKRRIPNGFAVLENIKTGRRRLIPLANIVTNAGDQYYAEAAVGAPSWSVAGMRLGTGTNAPTKNDTDVTTFLNGSGKAIDAGYPTTNDSDTDNSGAGIDVVSWRVSYTTAEANGNNISELAIVDNLTAPTKALTHALFAAAFNKTNNDTLKVFVNHTMNGV